MSSPKKMRILTKPIVETIEIEMTDVEAAKARTQGYTVKTK